MQAHNRWQIDFCSLAPARRRGLIQIFPNDVELALEEIRWGVEQDCFGGVLIPAVSPGDPLVAPLFHTRYEPIWALCADLDLTVVQHAGAGSPEMPMDQPASNAVLITEMAMWAQRTLGHLILAGVFERYPTLRFVPTEQGTYWVPGQIGMLDAMVPTMKSEAGNRTYGMFGGSSVDGLTLTPSEYVKRNCFFATELTPFDSGMIDFVGPEHIMWGSDYPHEEGFAPHSKLAIRWALHDRSAGCLPKDPGRQCRSPLPFRSRCIGAGGYQDRAHCRRGAHPSRGHGLSRPGRLRLPTVRRGAGPQAAGSGTTLTVGPMASAKAALSRLGRSAELRPQLGDRRAAHRLGAGDQAEHQGDAGLRLQDRGVDVAHLVGAVRCQADREPLLLMD